MEIIYSIILGFIQGATEFLPISSSGHLILIRDFLNIETQNDLAFDAILQLSTTFAVLIYFRKDLIRLIKNFFKKTKTDLNSAEISQDKKMVWGILFATIPVIILGLLLEEKMESIFRSSSLVALTLIIGAFIMWLADRFSHQNKNNSIPRYFIVGLFQSLALIPGMSRSGMTISGGLLVGLKREDAIRFSFLLAIPILLGTGFKKLIDLFQYGLIGDLGFSVLIGSISAFVFGILAIHFLITYLKNHTFTVFIVYRFILAMIILLFI